LFSSSREERQLFGKRQAVNPSQSGEAWIASFFDLWLFQKSHQGLFCNGERIRFLKESRLLYRRRLLYR
jgi:hypothetical protein